MTINDISSQTRAESTKLTIPIIEITRECIVCMTEKSLNEFEGIYSDSCIHIERTVCNSCVYENTKSLVADSIIYFEDITCPELNCHAILDYNGIRQILVNIGNNQTFFEQYDQHLINLQLSLMSDFIWCAYGCGSGQLYDITGSENPAVTCLKCNRRTCFKHRVIWHTDMTCDQYDLLESQSSESDANNKWLELFTKKCSQCQWYIQKNEGCDHMTCRYCKHEFCWECLADYKLIASRGNSQHKTSCNYYQPDTSTSSTQR
ncbi:hypothetical protein I4U23_016533 [Adineta vaga]|nr:hypothetical protein I4U23_016533 [Adineta vaga]